MLLKHSKQLKPRTDLSSLNLVDVFSDTVSIKLREAMGKGSAENLIVSKIRNHFQITYSQAEKKLYKYQIDPVYFFENFLKSGPLWDKQVEIAEAVRDHERVTVRSANGMGKDWVSARISLWFTYVFPPAIALTTAPTGRQVEKLLWKEIRSAHAGSIIKLADCLNTDLKISPDWYMTGFSSKPGETETAQGFHSPNMFVCSDEASGLARSHFYAVDGILTSENVRWLLISNPMANDGYFFETFTMDNWHKIHIDAWDSPNVKAKKVIIPGLTTYDWVMKRTKEYGEGSALEQIKIRGNFAEEGEQNLISIKILSEAQDIKKPMDTGRHMGVDIAREGTDSSCAVLVVNNRVENIEKWHKQKTTYSTGKIIDLMKDWEVPAYNVHLDIIGLGAGVVDRLVELGHEVDGCNFAESAKHDLEWADYLSHDTLIKNRRAELYWILKCLIENQKFSIPERFASAWADLTAVRKTFTSAGEILLEPKERVKKRIGRSPDEGDAIVLSLSRIETTQFRSI